MSAVFDAFERPELLHFSKSVFILTFIFHCLPKHRSALCVVFLFMFLLEQRKLSHYAMVESPLTLSAYMAGEKLMTSNSDTHFAEKVTLTDLGLEDFDQEEVKVPVVEFGTIEVNPDDPLANDELASDPFVGNHPAHPELAVDEANVDAFASVHGDERFELLKTVVVGWGVTPSEVLDNVHGPQYRALSWLAHEDMLRYTPKSDFWIKRIVQRYVLAVLYFATNGPGWGDTYNFLSEHEECNWNRKNRGYFHGVGHCEGGFITVLALWENGLQGGEFLSSSDCLGF